MWGMSARDSTGKSVRASYASDGDLRGRTCTSLHKMSGVDAQMAVWHKQG